MWKIAYNLLHLAAVPILLIVALFKPKLRKNLMERLFPAPIDQEKKGGLWIHAASLGEAVIAENLLKYLTAQSTRTSFVISTNTHYTRDLLRNRRGNSAEISSAPLDLPFSIGRFLGSRRPDALVLIETEVWPNLIWMAKARGIPVIILNGRISDSTIGRYKRLSFFLGDVLRLVDLVLAQSDEHARRFIALGVDGSRVVTTGNLKYYRDIETAGDSVPAKSAITFGSIREKELPMIMPLLSRIKVVYPQRPVYIAPRELHLVSEIERQVPDGLTSCRYSKVKDAGVRADVVVVDTVGDLLQVYAESTVAFVGGSLAPYGGQNVLEPLFVGTPVLFGPYVDNFRLVADQIIDSKAGIMVHDAEALYSAISLVLTDNTAREALVKAGSRVLDEQRGAMKKSADLILETIWKNSRNSSN